MPSPHVKNALEPLFVSKTETIRLIGSRKLVERMLYSVNQNHEDKWLTVVTHSPGANKGKLIAVESIRLAANRLKNGDLPPQFPSDEKSSTKFIVTGEKPEVIK